MATGELPERPGRPRWPVATGPAVTILGASTRGGLFAGLFLLGIANALALPVYRCIAETGLVAAVMATFDVSALVWIACLAVPAMTVQSRADRFGRFDRPVALAALAMAICPLPYASWLAITGVALFLIVAPGNPDPALRRGAIVALAIVTAMFWGRLLLQNSGDAILTADAAFVALLTGATHAGNVIQTRGDGGYLWVAPYCSSLSNVSLAILCSALVVQWRGVRWNTAHLVRCIMAAVAVIVVNDLRISAMVVRPDLYDLVHGPVGASIASLTTVAVVAAIILTGSEHDRPRPA